MISNTSLMRILEATTTNLDFDDNGDSNCGHGLIDAKKGYDAVICSMLHSMNSCQKERRTNCVWLKEWKLCSAASFMEKDLYSSLEH